MNRFAIIYELKSETRVRIDNPGYAMWEYISWLNQPDAYSSVLWYGMDGAKTMVEECALRLTNKGTFRMISEDELGMLLILCA